MPTLLVTAVAALVLSGCAGTQKLNVLPRTPARSGVTTTALRPKGLASPQVLRLSRCELRFTGVSEAMGTGTEGTVSYFLEMRFVNDGRVCTVGSKSRLIMTARTDTHGLVRARLSNGRFPIRHREHVTMVVGISWELHSVCSPGGISSVVVHSRRGTQTVSFPGHRYFVCTPASTGFYFMRFPA